MNGGFKCTAAVGLDRVWMTAILIVCPLVTEPFATGMSPHSHKQERLSIWQGNYCVNVLCSLSQGNNVKGTCWQQETLLIFALSSSVEQHCDAL